MTKLAMTLSAAAMLAGCTTTTGRHVAAGAVVGVATGGTAAAAVAGARVGMLVRNLRNGNCQYRDPQTGELFTARC